MPLNVLASVFYHLLKMRLLIVICLVRRLEGEVKFMAYCLRHGIPSEEKIGSGLLPNSDFNELCDTSEKE